MEIENHINNISSFIIFLEEYKKIISNKNIKNKNISLNFYLNDIEIENIKDKLLDTIQSLDDTNISDVIKEEIIEHNKVNNDIKDMMPLISLCYFLKNFS